MAGRGQRFLDAGFKTPKPFIDIFGTSLIEIVLENINLKDAHFYLIASSMHRKNQHQIILNIQKKYPVTFIFIDEITEGSACTVLHARKYINNNHPLLIANSDQYVELDFNDYISDCNERGLDGSILTFIDEEKNSKWSFARVDKRGLVIETREKQVISEYATVGVYYFSRGSSFVNGAIDMFVSKDRVNGEFYTCPVYNYCIRNGENIGIFNMPAAKMHGLGTPEDMKSFIARNIWP